jgi:hypothetical protein
MQFTIPTTRDEMYLTLKDIFNFYRIKRMQYEGIELLPFTLERMTDLSLTDEEITAKAQNLLGGEWEEKLFNYKNNLQQRISELKLKIEKHDADCDAEIKSQTEYYSSLLEKYRVVHYKNGMEESGLYVDKLLKIDQEKTLSIEKIQAKKQTYQDKLNQEIAALNQAVDQAGEYFEGLFNKQLQTKIQQLKDEREEYKREVFKYNNSVNEKEVRYTNTVAQVSANLELKYIQIKANELSKDELIEMGYYEDAINCVVGYYDSLSPATAYTQIKDERKLAIYLDDYYQDIMYRYKLRAE